MIKQIVLLKLKEGVTQAQIDEANEKTDQLFATLDLEARPLIERGPNVAEFGLDKGFNLCCVITFKSREDLDSFMTSADRQRMSSQIW